MKFQAPPGVAALSCAGENIVPDAQGFFEADEVFASDLLAHGCVPAPRRADPPASPAKPKNKRKAD
ncbi:hypothetical protein SAMN06265338_101739 [Rhodoblastus acidophilus]|uniref:Uncharacterized protein n=1 Tax=Rhodoblastus acidophilus TaxID=1074 RepID=A0A212QLP2_RHOAC|nr:hypothetical protein CKO16_03390 [Rhodoblastus acidophilus]RAI23837.1 hypothetical protein CH337_03000 [Rhodoblastus acidophilus]SNB60141.1 hypothetical protein SAMN06265338_101739 [Rhodoblastus acidophilus]